MRENVLMYVVSNETSETLKTSKVCISTIYIHQGEIGP